MHACVIDNIPFQSLTGAGGGGYLVAITKEPNMRNVIEEALAKLLGGRDEVKDAFVCKSVTIDRVGLEVLVDGEARAIYDDESA